MIDIITWIELNIKYIFICVYCILLSILASNMLYRNKRIETQEETLLDDRSIYTYGYYYNPHYADLGQSGVGTYIRIGDIVAVTDVGFGSVRSIEGRFVRVDFFNGSDFALSIDNSLRVNIHPYETIQFRDMYSESVLTLIKDQYIARNDTALSNSRW